MKRAERLKILRLLSGFTQSELADKVKLTQSSFAKMEKGTYGAVGETGIRIATALGVEFDYLYLGSPAVDSINSIVWIPSPPTRSQYFQALINDITQLFPLFLLENGFNIVIPGKLGDGGFAFLIGRDTGIRKDFGADYDEKRIVTSDYVIKRKKELTFTSLLLADSRISDCFKTAFKTAGGRIFGEMMLQDSTIDSFDANVLNRMANNGYYISIDIDELSRKLAKCRKYDYNHKSLPSIDYLFALFVDQMKQYDVPFEAMPDISRYFSTKCQEIALLAENRINTLAILKELNKKLASLGCKKIAEKIEKPDQSLLELKDENYQLIQEWLRETWLTSTESQKAKIVDTIKLNTDFNSWLENYYKDVNLRPVS